MKNMLRNLAYASIILAALTVAGHELAGVAKAGGGRFIAAGDYQHVIDSDGVVYQRGGAGTSTTWTQVFSFAPIASPPAWFNYDGSTAGSALVCENGDVYDQGYVGGPPRYIGNVFTGYGPIAVEATTWSGIKGRFAPKAGGGK